MTKPCSRFQAIPPEMNPIVFCSLLEKKCPQRKAMHFSTRTPCHYDWS